MAGEVQGIFLPGNIFNFDVIFFKFITADLVSIFEIKKDFLNKFD